MMEAYRLQVGVYGFLVNVVRELWTVLFILVFVKSSEDRRIAGDVVENMDNMLALVMEFVGVRLLVTGRVLTFVVSVLLPLIGSRVGTGLFAVEACVDEGLCSVGCAIE